MRRGADMIDSVNADPRGAVRQLLLDVRAGDQNAFAQLYERYLPLIGRLIAQFSSGFVCAEDAEDFRQEAALALYQAAMAYRLDQHEVEFGLFAKICMTNRMIDKLRVLDRYVKNEVRAEDGGDEIDRLPLSASAQDPAAHLLDAEAVASITAVIDGNLSGYERRVFKLYLSGYSAREIARTVAKDEKSVTNAIYRIRRKLKTLLQS